VPGVGARPGAALTFERLPGPPSPWRRNHLRNILCTSLVIPYDVKMYGGTPA
jgi:hypothetical protein